MNTEIQKAYMRGYAKGRAFKKKAVDPKLSAIYKELNASGWDQPFFKRVFAAFRNGLSL